MRSRPALGMALAARVQHHDYRVYVLLGDGELHEGQVLGGGDGGRAPPRRANLIAIVDRNDYCSTGASTT